MEAEAILADPEGQILATRGALVVISLRLEHDGVLCVDPFV